MWIKIIPVILNRDLYLTPKTKKIMSQKVTLGGDRLGSGKRMKVDLHGYERSTHNKGYLWRNTMSPGTLVPFMSEVGLPGDTFDINLNCDIKTHPTIGPLFGSYKVQLDVFMCPMRLYNAYLHNNALNIGRKMSTIKLPQIEFTVFEAPTIGSTVDWDNIHVNPSCLLAYLGYRGFGNNPEALGAGTQTRQMNAIPIICYWDIYKQYYSNKQEEKGAVIHNGFTANITTVTNPIERTNSDGTENIDDTTPGFVTIFTGDIITITYSGTTPSLEQIMIITDQLGAIPLSQLLQNINTTATTIQGTYNGTKGNLTASLWRYRTPGDVTQTAPVVELFDLTNIDDMRNKILTFQSTTAPFVINSELPTLKPYQYLWDTPATGYYYTTSTQEGLAVKTYQSDLLNNWMNTDFIDGVGGINEITAVDTSAGNFEIAALILSRKVFDMLNRIAITGGTYKDWLEVVYDHESYWQCESPMYMGGLSKEVVFQEVISNSASTSENGTQPLGTLAGRGITGHKHKGGTVVIKCDEPCYIMGIASITPRIDYSQGNSWDVNIQTMDDWHKPALDQIGFQELIFEQGAWWTTIWDGTKWSQQSAGKQPAWLNYMTNINRTYGNFAIKTNEMFMTLNRRYETEGDGILDLTTYIDPAKFNYIFAETSLDAMNFWTQIAVDITARRKMSAKLMPNL